MKGVLKVANKKKSNVGRPTKMTAEMVKKLEYGFMKGLTDDECCLFCDITKQTLYNYCHEHPDFFDRKELLKKKPSVAAKINVVESIEAGDPDTSKWYLERRNKEEFSTKQDVGVTGSINNPFEGLSTEELKKLIASE